MIGDISANDNAAVTVWSASSVTVIISCLVLWSMPSLKGNILAI